MKNPLKNTTPWYLPLLAALLSGLLTCFSISAPVSAAPPQAQLRQPAASPHLIGCTPYAYHLAYQTTLRDQGTGTPIGSVDLFADRCGWVYAEAQASDSFPAGFAPGIINHLIISNSHGQAVTSAFYNGQDFDLTDKLPTHGDSYSAFAVIQNSALGYWGTGRTSGANGFWYSSD
jgi:hypothetical protein